MWSPAIFVPMSRGITCLRVLSAKGLQIIHQVESQIYSEEYDAISTSVWRGWRSGCGERPLQVMGIRGVSGALESCACGRTKDRGTWRRHLLSGHWNWSCAMCFHKILEVFVSLCGTIHLSGPAETQGPVSLHIVKLPYRTKRK